MPALSRGETSDCSNTKLDLFTKVSGVPTDVSEVQFQIFEKVSNPSSPIQIHPVTPGDKVSLDLTACPLGDKVTTGHYVAPYTVPLGQVIGTHEIRWFFKLLPTALQQFFTEEFEVLGSPQPSVDDTYISISDVRAKGLNTDPPSDASIQAAICLWQAFIDRATRQWFRPIILEMNLDGTDSDALHFGVPIISIDEIRINGETTKLEAEKFKVYNAQQYPRDKQNPRIKLVDAFEAHRDIFTAPMRHGRSLFRKGRQNQFIKGTFGCVESDLSPPELIRHALCKLVIEKLLNPQIEGSQGVTPPPVIHGLTKEEWTDGHRIRYEAVGGGLKPRQPGLAGITDDQEILGIIRLYKAPIGLATPANPSYR